MLTRGLKWVKDELGFFIKDVARSDEQFTEAHAHAAVM
jgi:hypothetical protein